MKLNLKKKGIPVGGFSVFFSQLHGGRCDAV